MLDPAHPSPIDLTDFSSYLASCRAILEERLSPYRDVQEVAAEEESLNQYPRLARLAEPQEIVILDEAYLSGQDRERAVETLLRGGVLLEHACAGEATRLGLGSKYLINPARDLDDQVMERLLEGRPCAIDPQSLRPISLGRRHMLQLAWDLTRLAEESGQDPQKVLASQTLLIIINESSGSQVLDDFQEAAFYGFERSKVLFMVQRSFHGFNRKDGVWFLDRSSPKRLHNHGQMLLQTTMDGQLFRLDAAGRPQPLNWTDYRAILQGLADKVSFNIEDLDYLASSLDLQGLAAALKLGGQGCAMVMEVVANDPQKPIKGGMCAWDEDLGRNVMIESFQLAGLPNHEIKFFNKNINHYPRPLAAIEAAREQGLSMPLAVKKGFLYMQPVQGDINFLVPAAYVRRPIMKPINSWKSGANTPEALAAMARQDARPGFLEWAAKLTGLSL